MPIDLFKFWSVPTLAQFHTKHVMGFGGGQMARVLAFYSNDRSLNPAKVFILYFFEKNVK